MEYIDLENMTVCDLGNVAAEWGIKASSLIESWIRRDA